MMSPNSQHDADPSPKRQVRHKIESRLRAIHRALLHLGDNSYSFVYQSSHKDQDESQDNGCNCNEGNNRFDDSGLPFIGPGLKSQYEDLRSLLRRGLLGFEEDFEEAVDPAPKGKQGAKNEHEEPSDGNLTLDKNKANVSAVLMGPRGHGKSLVLERCLADLARLAARRKQQAQKRSRSTSGALEEEEDCTEDSHAVSFRVVRLNGLLYPGSNAVACAREIARQIGEMAREERKRKRKREKYFEKKKSKRVISSVRATRQETLQSSSLPINQLSQNISGCNDHLPALEPPPSESIRLSTPLLDPRQDQRHLRVRSSAFTTNIALLDEALRTARIDNIPILIVLEELDTFIAKKAASSLAKNDGSLLFHSSSSGSNDRQLLLYHLLDRVADHKFLLSLVGMTTRLNTIHRLEKRVQSRAEGTSKIIYFGHGSGYDCLVDTLLGKFYSPNSQIFRTGDIETSEWNEPNEMRTLRRELETILRGENSFSDSKSAKEREDNDDGSNPYQIVRRVMEHNYKLGKDIKWFSRVLSVALSLLASDNRQVQHNCLQPAINTIQESLPFVSLSPTHVAKALVTMGASIGNISSVIGRPGYSERNKDLSKWGHLLGNPSHHSVVIGVNNPRLRSLIDLSGPQIVILLAARRISAREDSRAIHAEKEWKAKSLQEGITKKKNKETGAKISLSGVDAWIAPLTYQRIHDEYIISFISSQRYTIGSYRYSSHVLQRACIDLMEMDIIRPKKEISGDNPLQYEHSEALSSGRDDVWNLPLNVNLDWNREFIGPLKAGVLNCSTALREWGMKTN